MRLLGTDRGHKDPAPVGRACACPGARGMRRGRAGPFRRVRAWS